MPWLIDGNNLMGTMKGMRMDDPEARRRLLRHILSFPLVREKGVVVVFDGAPNPADPRSDADLRPLRVRYSGAGRSADDAIAALLERSSPRHYRVVTSDRGLQARARARGARVVDCREFLEMLEAPGPDGGEAKAPDRKLAESEVDEWLRLFRERRRP